MAGIRTWTPPEEEAHPLFWVVVAVVLMGGILGATLVLSGGKGAGAAGGGGSFAPAPMLPQSPVGTSEPCGDAPPVTIIRDTRDFLHRLPLDRNTPKGWSNPVPGPEQPGKS